MKITERQLRGIIRKCLMEALEEGGTNLQSVYHFTNLCNVPGIFETGSLFTASDQKRMRNGKNYISFTRHRSNLEGFARANAEDTVAYARIELDGRALSNVRGANIYPFEYYSPNRRKTLPDYHDPNHVKHPFSPLHNKKPGWYGYDDTVSAAAIYQDPNFDDEGEWDFLHQAEESFETDAEEIPIMNSLVRIDIVVEYPIVKMVEYYDIDFVKDLVFDYLTEVMQTNSPLIDKCFVYENNNDFCLQNKNCVPLRKYYQYIKHVLERVQKAAEE